MSIKYADTVGPYTLYRSAPIRPHGQSQMGYGSKITTDIVLAFDGRNRVRRVYATCYSNAASLWIVYKGERLYLGTVFQDDIRPHPCDLAAEGVR